MEHLPLGPALADLAVSPDGRLLWLASRADPSRPAYELIGRPGELFVSLWDLERGQELGHMMTPPVASPSLVAVGSTRRVLVVHNEGGWLLDLATGGALSFPRLKRGLLAGPPHVNNAGTLATASVQTERGSRLWRIDLSTGRRMLDIAGDGPFALSGDDRYLVHRVTSGRGMALQVVRTDGGGIEREVPVKIGATLSTRFAFDDEGSAVAWVEGREIGVWRAGSEPRIRHIIGHSFITAPLLSFMPDGRTLACLTMEHSSTLHTIDTVGDGEPRKEHLGPVGPAAIAASGTSALVVTAHGLTRHVFSGSGAVSGPSRVFVARPAIDSVAVVSGLRLVATANRRSSQVTLRAPGKAGQLQSFDVGAGVRELHAGPDGVSLYVVGVDGSLSHLVPTRDPPVVRWACPYVYSSQFTISPDGQRAICMHGLVDGPRGRRYNDFALPMEKRDNYTVWELGSGRSLARDLGCLAKLAQSIAWVRGMPDAVRLRVGIGADVYNVKTGQRVLAGGLPGPSGADDPSAQLLPCGQRALVGSDKRLVVWDLQAHCVAVDICASERTHVLAVDPTGRHIAVSTRAEGPAIYSLEEDRRCVARLDAALAQEPVALAAWSPAGDELAVVTLSQRVVLVI